MRVFVTGSSSHLARAVLPRLCAQPGIESVAGIDLKPAQFSHPRFSAAQADIRDPRLAERLTGHDALIHLAFVVLRGRMSEEAMFEANVTAGHRVFHAARAAGVRRLIHLSSAAVYGHGVHLAENAPFAPLPGFLYARHKAHLEQLLALEFPDCVRLRPHVILGPDAQPLLRQLLKQPFHVRLPDPQPLMQCIHEDDVARAVMLALERDVRGAFNLATDDNFSFRDAIRERHLVSIPLSPALARWGVHLASRTLGWGGEPAWVEGLTRTLLLNCRRAATELGWRSSHTAAQVLAQT